MFVKNDWFNYGNKQQDVVEVKGIMRSGIVSSSFIKAELCLSGVDDDDEEGSDEDEDDSSEEEQENANEMANADGEDKNNMPLHEQINEKMLKLSRQYPFLMLEPDYMKVLWQSYEVYYKVRVYLLSGQNISAMSNEIDMKSRLAGMSAMCTANPFPVLKTGDGVNDDILRLNKSIYDIDATMEGNLNPEFLKIYELDAKLPEDWQLDVAIYDKGKFRN